MKFIAITFLTLCISFQIVAQSLSSGNAHGVFVCPDSTLRAWGLNNNGQLGDSSTVNKVSPVPVWHMKDVVALGGGVDHSIALRADGTVWTWGLNVDGQLGDSTSIKGLVPKKVHGPGNVGFLSDIRSISNGHLHHHNLAIPADSTVWAWGFNMHGQLGDSSTANRWVPVKVYGLSDVTKVSCGDVHSIALRKDSTVWTWGLNNKGMLGDSSTVRKIIPVKVYGLNKVTAISGGELHSLALRADSTVWAWGANYIGQLGDSTNVDRIIPVKTYGLNKVIAIAAGSEFSLALRADSTVWTWGNNFTGQLGDSTLVSKPIPVQVKNLKSVVEITGGGTIAYAKKNDGTLWSWGMGTFGQLGNGSTGYAPCNCSPVPVQVSGPCSLPVNVEEKDPEEPFLIYPNPSTGRLSIKNSTPNTSAELKIFHVTGKLMLQRTLNTELESFSLELSNGIYFLQIVSGSETTNRKIIIQR